MAWIDIPGPDDDPDLADRHARYGGGQPLDEVLSVHGLHPEGMDAHWAVYRAAMTPTASLRLADRELVALVVSAVNGCHY